MSEFTMDIAALEELPEVELGGHGHGHCHGHGGGCGFTCGASCFISSIIIIL